MPNVRMPDGTVVGFPDTMPPDQIKGMIASKWPEINSGVSVTPDNVVRSLARGVPGVGSFLDEANAATNATLAPVLNPFFAAADQLKGTWQERYDRSVAQQRAKDTSFDANHPVMSPALQITGGIASTIPLAATAAGAKVLGLTGDTLLTRMASGVGSGAVLGGLSGAGNAEGSLPDRLPGAAEGMGVGAGIGLVAPLAGAALGSTVSGLTKQVMKIRGPFKDAAEILGYKSGDAVTLATAPHVMAAQQLGRAVNADDLTTASLRMAGRDAMMGEVGPNLTQQMAGIATKPGPGQTTIRDALKARLAGRGTRLNGALDAVLGPATAEQTAVDIAAAQSAAAKPLYDQAYKVPIVITPEIKAVLDTPAGKKAMAIASTKALNEGFAIDWANPDIRAMDYVKRALGDRVSTTIRSGASDNARIFSNMKNRFVAAVDAQNTSGEYAAARAAYAGPAEVLDAMESGQSVFERNVSPFTLQSELTKFNPSEHAAYQQGARAAVAKVFGNNPATAVSMFDKELHPWNFDKLRLLVGQEQADKLVFEASREHILSAASALATANSKTGMVTAAQNDLANNNPAGKLLSTAKFAFLLNGVKGLMRSGALYGAEGLVSAHDATRIEQVAAIMARGLTLSGSQRNALIAALQRGNAMTHSATALGSAFNMITRGGVIGGGLAEIPLAPGQFRQGPNQ